MQVCQPLLVEPAQRVDERLRQHLSRPGPQARVPAGVGQPDGAAQGGDPRLDRTGRDGGRTRLDGGLHRGAGGHPRAFAPALAHGRLDRRPGRHPQLRLEQCAPCGVLLLRRRVVAHLPVEPDQRGPGGSRRAGSSRRPGRRIPAPGRAPPAPSAPGLPRAGPPPRRQRPGDARRATTTRRRVLPARARHRAARHRGPPPRRPRPTPDRARRGRPPHPPGSAAPRGPRPPRRSSPRLRRSSARLQRSARNGSSASLNRSAASWLLAGGASAIRRYASRAQLFRLRSR